MKTRRIIWWIALSLLSSGAILSILVAWSISSEQSQRLDELSAFFRQNPVEWEGVEIAGRPLRLFQKDLWLNNSISLDFAALASALLGLLVILLAVTLVFEKRKNRKT